MFVPTQKPVFLQNPLRFMMNNPYSGTLNINNLNQINRLYELMREGLTQQVVSQVPTYPNYNNFNSTNLNSNIPSQGGASGSTHHHPIFFTTTSTTTAQPAKPKNIFVTVKGNKIFNIVKDPQNNTRRKNVTIVYDNNRDLGGHQNFEEEEVLPEEYDVENIKEDYAEEMVEGEEIIDENVDNGDAYDYHPWEGAFK